MGNKPKRKDFEATLKKNRDTLEQGMATAVLLSTTTRILRYQCRYVGYFGPQAARSSSPPGRSGGTVGEVIGELLPLAIGVAISPIPIIAVILMLLAPKARDTGLGFLAGWALGIVLTTVVLVLIANGIGMASSPGEPKTSVSWIKLLLGILLLVLAVQQWTSRPKAGASAELPGWMRAIDKVTPARAASLGLLLSAANPKNLMMCVAAGIAIGQGELSAGGDIVAILIFTLIAACSVTVPVIVYVSNAERVRAPLEDLKAWLEANSATVMFVLLLVIGAVLIGKGLGGIID
ncbi:GAP family protein [Actinomadura sp. 9N407]|uniref:GAP family protein n=1 Tax=Actinomadura sp. 9N407 TaxID=3375154 RepID=UPI0037BC83B7